MTEAPSALMHRFADRLSMIGMWISGHELREIAADVRKLERFCDETVQNAAEDARIASESAGYGNVVAFRRASERPA